MKNYTYMLRCGDGSYYTGWTNNLVRRIHMHQKGKGGKYTRSHLPVQLVYAEVFDHPHDARIREAAIKKLSREKKEELVHSVTSEDLERILKECREDSSASGADKK
ncbi:MAG: GIY-YIG nuclease family protein [Eubacterium sp.]|jgi:putative endonuclease|nr:GIY-YIG nuclease family protein [Eubacterium sp.]MCH4046457.1 GIY-YIG nuclease family protein [Eubacterium sp.]MCH4079552.1 GIY-YIG nuclease family protein [Eubacterium sp.]MCH4111132.1 GIY-YIG nuclease family protein [Eubacterium sp.]MCI1307364.1 GIY-YIG nuclease family protein [Eubacterium sp.]